MRLVDKLVDTGVWQKKLHASYFGGDGGSVGVGMGQYNPVGDLNASRSK